MAIRRLSIGGGRDWEEMEEKGESLYTAYLLPGEDELTSKFGQDKTEKIIYRILDGGETWVTVGRPVYNDMLKFCQQADLAPSQDLKVQMENYKFGYLRLHCGFGSHEIPPTPHPMILGKMTISLSCQPIGNDKPMAFNWCPKDTYDKQRIEDEFSISSNFDFVPVQAGFSRKAEKILYKPRITVIGGLSDKITWQYHSTPTNKQVIGDRESLMIVRLPIDAKKLKVSVDVQAKIKEGFLSKVFNKSKKWTEDDFKGLSEEEFMLSRAIQITYRDLHDKRTEPNFADDLLNRNVMSEEDKAITFTLS